MNIVQDYTEVVYENYNTFLKEHDEMFASPGKAMEMLATTGSFNAFVSQLTDTMSKDAKYAVEQVLGREREMLLQEAAGSGQIASTAQAIGYAVSYFPILADIYSDPVISQIATVYPVNKSILTIPKVTLHASVNNADGSTSSWRMPRTENLIRQKAVEVTLSEGISNDTFSFGGSQVEATTSRLNKRYFLINKVSVSNDGQGAAAEIPVMIRPDARGQLKDIFTWQDSAGVPNTMTSKLYGHVDWDTGTVTYTLSHTGGGTVVNDTTTASCVFSPKTSDIGRTKVQLKMEGWDVDVDNKEEFEIELQTEQIQDFKDIYNIDLLRTLSMAIKTQMLLNKDQDLAYFLNAYKPIFAANGAAATCDLESFTTNAVNPQFTPANIMDVFKGVIPFITSTTRRIHRNFRAAPQYLVAGEKTAAILESLQDYVVRVPGMNYGEMGARESNVINFKKQTVLACNALPENEIFLVYKAATDDLSRTAIADIIYKPLFIVEEITNSMKRTFVKSRTTLEFTSLDAMGVVTISGYEDFLTTSIPTP